MNQDQPSPIEEPYDDLRQPSPDRAVVEQILRRRFVHVESSMQGSLDAGLRPVDERIKEATDAILGMLDRAKLDEAIQWLNMVFRHDRSRLDSNEWYRLNPRDVTKFYNERVAALSKGADKE